MPDTEIFDRLAVDPDPGELLRTLGYPPGTAPSPEVAAYLEQTIPQALELIFARGLYSVHAVLGRTPRALRLERATIEGDVGRFLGDVGRIAVFVVTVGLEIGEASEAAFRSGDALVGWLYDAVGSWAVEAAADGLLAGLRARLGPEEGHTLRYSPGYCGMDLDQQRILFELVRADSIGVALLSSLMMQPTKSISGIIGIGPRAQMESERSACDRCSEKGCHMRR